MTPESAVQLVRQMLLTALMLGAPILLLGFLVGVLINVVQVATSMQDSAFSAVPRLAAFLFGFLLLAPWMLRHICTYTVLLISSMSSYAR
jgi:flagellar biosynthetic protein FliQ